MGQNYEGSGLLLFHVLEMSEEICLLWFCRLPCQDLDLSCSNVKRCL